MSQTITPVIVHYHNQKLLEKQLRVLGKELSVIVVDNSQELKSKDLPSNVKLISLPFNMGFAHGCNQGLAEVKSEWVLFLNPDVEITSSQIESLIDQAQSQKLAAVSPLPAEKKYRQGLPSLGAVFNQFTPLQKLRLPKFNWHYTLTGGVLLAQTKIIKQLGGWDERFFLWFEDSDLTKRLIDNGHKVGWAKIKFTHRGGGSVSKLSQQQQRDLFFNALKVYAAKYWTPIEQRLLAIVTRKYTRRQLLPTINPEVTSMVVPNLKKKLLISFLEENRSFLSPQNRQIEWIVVSSGLKNDELWTLRQKYPQIRFVSIKDNHGFAQTVNIGLRVATGRWLGTINDDVILEKDWLDNLLRPIERDQHLNQKLGSLNPLIENPSQQIESVGIEVLAKGKALPITDLNSNSLTPVAKNLFEVDVTNGAAVIYAREALNQVGLFDSRFGSYLEDIDLSLRLKRAGFKNLVNTQVKITHLKHKTSSQINLNKSWLDLKNWWLVICKNWSLLTWLKHGPQILLERGRNLSGLLKSLTWLQRLTLLLVIILPAFYVWSRLYQLETSLLFFNDIGRDFLVLLDWQKTGKPPLLGPQTSALPYNQSAIYFYLLMPLFLLMGHSPFATIWSCLLFYVVLFIWGAWKFKAKPAFLGSLLITSFLITIQPQFIAQTRFVWNPSFVGPLIMISVYGFLLLKEKFSWAKLLVVSLAATLAVSLNYSVAPFLLALMIYSLWGLRQKLNWIKLWLMMALSGLFWNLPTVFFELRHHFLLTKMLLTQEKLTQVNLTFLAKANDLIRFTLPHFSLPLGLILLAMLGLALVVSLVYQKPKNSYLLDTVIIFLLALAITLVVPIAVQAHYIFGILTLGFLIVSFLDLKFSLLIVALLSALWLPPLLRGEYFRPAFRSVATTQQCAQVVCSQVTAPVFVSVQSDLHPYHNGMEWQYMFAQAGCQIKSLDTERNQAQQMLVVVDHSQYQHGKTAYNELTQFGPSHQTQKITCQENLEVMLLTSDQK